MNFLKGLGLIAVALLFLPFLQRAVIPCRVAISGVCRRCRRSWVEGILLSVTLVGLVHVGSTKGTNGAMRVPAPARACAVAQTVGEESGEADAADLRFVEFSVSTGAVRFVAGWSPDMALPFGQLDLFAAHDVDTNAWAWIGSFAIPSVATNLVAEVPCSEFPAEWMSRLFLRLGTFADEDGDGLPDARERLALGTSPWHADTDGDGVLDGDEFASGLNPRNPDADGDGFADGEEIAAGTDPRSYTPGAGGVIRYRYDDDDRLVSSCAGDNLTSRSQSLSPSGNAEMTIEH